MLLSRLFLFTETFFKILTSISYSVVRLFENNQEADIFLFSFNHSIELLIEDVLTFFRISCFLTFVRSFYATQDAVPGI